MLLPQSFTQPGRTALLTLTGPIEMGMSKAFETVASLPRRFRDSEELESRNRELANEVEELRSQVMALEAERERYEYDIMQLRRFDEVPGLKNDFVPMLTQIISKRYVRNMTGIADNTMKIGIGSNQGVKTGDLVIVEHAVVGIVATVSPFVSKVRLVTHKDFDISARTSKTRVEGHFEGNGFDRGVLTPLPERPRFVVGDAVLTSGLHDKHPPGLLLGTVESVSRATDGPEFHVTVKPAFRLDRLHRVVVVRRRDAAN